MQLGRVDDEHLGIVEKCGTQPNLTYFYRVVDVASRAITASINLGQELPASVSWQPGLGRGYLDIRHGAKGECWGTAPLTTAVQTRFSHEFLFSGGQWAIDGPFDISNGADCTKFGLTADATLLSDRTTVLLAAPSVVGIANDMRVGIALGDGLRDDIDWGVYSLDGNQNREARLMLDGFGPPKGLAVAPDGSKAVVSARHEGKDGLWYLNLGAESARLLATGRFASPALSTDGSRLVFIRYRGSKATLDVIAV
jgi:hypothetical protein